jgi:predicted nucleic acid-binding protein
MTPNPTKIPSALRPLAEELLENSYARDNLQEGAEKLRDAYQRSQKRRVKPSKDRKLRRQIEAAIAAIDEGTAALASGRKKPKRTGRKAALVLIGAAAAGAGVVLATNEDIRNQVLGSAKALGDEIAGGGDEGASQGGGGNGSSS